MTLDDYLERVLYRFFEEYLRILETDGAAWPVSYHDGAVNMVQELARRSGISITDETLDAIKARAKFHAKYPDKLFAEAPGEPREMQADRLFRQLNELKTRMAASV